jgi:hypothetical protein
VTAKVARRGYRIVEVPIGYTPRSLEEGKKLRLRDGLIAIWTLFRWRFWHRERVGDAAQRRTPS